MDKNAFQKLLDADQLKAAVNVLVEQKTASKTARSLRGRLIELEKQNNRGTFNKEAYSIERNRIRASLLDIMHGEEDDGLDGISSIKGANSWKLLPLLGVALLVIATLVYFNQKGDTKSNGSTVVNTVKENGERENENKVETKERLSLNQVADLLQKDLKKKTLGFESEPIAMSEKRTYKQVLATLTRKYTWNVIFPVTVGMTGITVQTNEAKQKLLVKVDRLKISERFSIGNKKATTVANSLWIEDTSKDGSFWEKVDQVTKGKMKKEVFDNKRVTNKMKSTTTTLIINEINKILEGTGAENNSIEITINNVGY